MSVTQTGGVGAGSANPAADVPRDLIIKAYKSPGTIGKDVAIVEQMMDAGDWAGVRWAISYAKKHYSEDCQEALARSLVKRDDEHHDLPRDLLMAAYKSPGTIGQGVTIVEKMMDSGDWDGVRWAISYAKKHYSERCQELLAESLVKRDDEHHDLPRDLLMEAYKSPGTIGQDVTIVEKMMDAGDWDGVRWAISYAKKHYSERCQELLAESLVKRDDEHHDLPETVREQLPGYHEVAEAKAAGTAEEQDSVTCEIPYALKNDFVETVASNGARGLDIMDSCKAEALKKAAQLFGSADNLACLWDMRYTDYVNAAGERIVATVTPRCRPAE